MRVRDQCYQQIINLSISIRHDCRHKVIRESQTAVNVS